MHDNINFQGMNISKTLLAVFFSTCCSLTSWGQAQVRYKDVVQELGNLNWKVPTTVRFQLTNTGNIPLLIEEVSPDCGCTHATWTRQPIPAGGSTTITANFDAQTLGTFSKQLKVKTNADVEAKYLVFKGRVVAEVLDLEKGFPYKIGDIHLSTDNVEFDDVQRGELQDRVIYVHNGTKQNYMPQLLHLPKYLSAYAEPEVLRPGRVGRLRLSLNSNELHNMGLTQTSIYLARFSGDRVGRETEIGVSATLLPPHLAGEEALHLAPVAQMDTLVNLGTFGKKKKIKGELWVANIGRSNLKISALQVYNPGISVQLGKANIAPGERVKMKITANADFDLFKGSHRILLISNDPRRPKTVISVLMKK